MHPNVHSSTIYNSQAGGNLSAHQQISGSKNYGTFAMEFYAAERKKELIPFATAWMELESIMLSEISQAVRDKYHMISPLTGT